ncbi:dipeptidyl peptidase 1-like [Lethenteron reissneri]|uniref:dipeptidyl peptidase 1-like n=1 Tax=Lethenteron reissneri TaxID=7753 RepID=UPI002AB6E608|nr:dipeptidyl peptidase 1-like [Lethenteron reissneri]
MARTPPLLLMLLPLLLLLPGQAGADLPVNCSFEDLVGTWEMEVGPVNSGPQVDCEPAGKAVQVVRLHLLKMNVAADEKGNQGTFTIIYNQGFEVVLTGYKWFAFFNFTKVGTVVTSLCAETRAGWVHDVLGRNWACFRGRRVKPPSWRGAEAAGGGEEGGVGSQWSVQEAPSTRLYEHNAAFMQQVNEAQHSWRAVRYPLYDGLSLGELTRRAGGRASRIHGRPKSSVVTEETRRLASTLPTSWDWRNVNGINYVSPIRNQGSCGSCYSFSSMAMLEARIRILTNASQAPILSTQQIVSCSNFSQGCDGGFPYLIGGKYAQDFGLVEESCYPYTGRDDATCRPLRADCYRFYAAHYGYVGGYYGACNDELMRLELVTHGPIVVGLQVYDDLLHYRGGVYHHTGLRDSFNPFEETNHAVAVVGYGVEPGTGERYWVVKNSWGEEWGERGYFRIRRGSDECGIESIAVFAKPIPHV